MLPAASARYLGAWITFSMRSMLGAMWTKMQPPRIALEMIPTCPDTTALHTRTHAPDIVSTRRQNVEAEKKTLRGREKEKERARADRRH
eukprot:1345714-Rhodomonas_salina.1